MRDSRDFQIEIMGSGKRGEHAHSAVQFIYVVSGTADLSVQDAAYEMHQDDVILINAMVPHAFRVRKGGIICILKIEYRIITSLMPDAGGIFLLNSLTEPERPYEEIRSLFHEIVYLENMGDPGSVSRIYRDLYELLHILFVHCMVRHPGRAAGQTKLSDDEKLQQIIAYVSAHYQESFSLSALAKEMYVSTSTLSRFFRKQTGIYFADYVNEVRLTHAVGEMRYTGKSLTRIAADCGFSNASVFAKLFHEKYGLSPNVWRKKTAEEEKKHREDEAALRKEVQDRLKKQQGRRNELIKGQELVLPVSSTQRLHQPFARVVTIGSMSDLAKANLQFHLLYAVRELHVTHARIWSVFAKDLQITDGRTLGNYNYNAIDAVLDTLVENHIGVYFDFGNRPTMAARTMSKPVYDEDRQIPFVSRRAFESLFEDFVMHLVRRYGREEVRNWIFDFNEDPSYRGASRYYADPEYDFMNVWEFGSRTVRRIVEGARVGGPVGLPNGTRDEIRHFLEEAGKRDCLPDFLSLILFPYQPSADGGTERDPDPLFEERQLRNVKQILTAAGLPDLPVYVVDWNMAVSTRNILNDSCFRGAYLCARAHTMMRYADVVSIWVVSDWISSYFDSRSILNGGGGMLTRDSIRKPVFFAQQFLSRLSGTVLYADANLIVTMRSADSFMILAVNDVPFHVSYYLKEEDEILPDESDQVVSEGKPAAFDLFLSGLADGDEYIVKTRSVSRHHGSILDEWKRFRYETSLERQDIKYLQEICVPHMSMERRKVSGGRLPIRVVLDAQEFQLLHVYRYRNI